jgi:hypothetical protein
MFETPGSIETHRNQLSAIREEQKIDRIQDGVEKQIQAPAALKS